MFQDMFVDQMYVPPCVYGSDICSMRSILARKFTYCYLYILQKVYSSNFESVMCKFYVIIYRCSNRYMFGEMCVQLNVL